MKLRLCLLTLAVAVLMIGSAQARPDDDSTPYSCDGKTMSHHVHRARVLIQTAYDLDRWADPTPAKSSEKRAWQKHRRCVLYAPERFELAAYRDKMADRFDEHRAMRLVTPYYFGEPGIEYVAIPPYIVKCETRGYYGESRWRAYNSSGALGPYQLLGKGAPFPVDSEADKLAHHQIASDLWAGGAGASHWVCA